MYGMGWLVCLLSTLFIDHFNLRGSRQAFLYGRGETDGPAVEEGLPSIKLFASQCI